MAAKKFPRGYMLEMLDSKHVVSDKIIDTTRWDILHELVFHDEDSGKFYQTCYYVGATENQHTLPWEYDDDGVECVEVQEVYKMLPVWEAV